MNRRHLLRALGMLAVDRLAHAQTRRPPYRIGFLGLSSPTDYAPFVNAFREALRQLGYEEGQNLTIEYRWANGHDERLPALAREIVRLAPDVLVTHAVGVAAAKDATSTVPIVMGASADPVAFGFVDSLARPGANVTGVASQLNDVASKRLELLKEVVPQLRNVSVVSNLALPAANAGLDAMRMAARRLDVRVTSFAVTVQRETLEAFFSAMRRQNADGLIVQPDPITGAHGRAIAAFALENRLPTIGGGRQFAIDGGLLSYGTNFEDGWRLAARYVDRILRGAKPGDLPVEQPGTFELVANESTARRLGLTLPQSLRVRAEILG